MYDVIVVGARCAGSPTAMLLARKGYRVLLVDRTNFPSDTVSTHAIHNSGVARLKSWGLLDRVVASGCPPVLKYVLHMGPITLAGAPPAADGVAEAHAPRRTVLDAILVEAAAEAGAEVRGGLFVEEILRDKDRAAGIRGRLNGGAVLTEKGRLVVGADGVHSVVARVVGASLYNVQPSLACYYYSYWSGVSLPDFHLHLVESRFLLAVPTNDRLTLVGVGSPHAVFQTMRADIQGNFLRALDLAPELAERVRAGRREERFVGTADVPNFFHKPYGPGWALVGDAGYHKDPITAQGITDAFHDAELLVEAIDAGFSGSRPLEHALADYERQRNQRVGPIYDLTCKLATLRPPPPDMQRLLSALPGNQAQTDRFFGAIMSGTVPIPDFFSPDNVREIVGTRNHEALTPASK